MAAPPRHPTDGDGGGGEDRLSALPEDVIIHILLKLRDAAAAARTSVLSRHWRPIWTLLPELCFHPATGPHGLRAALESHGAPALRRLDVSVVDAIPESVAAWLPIAVRLLSGDLKLINTVQQDETEDEEAAEGGALELPCFEDATSICLQLDYLGLALPPSGVFAGLGDLFLAYIVLQGPCMLGDAVSSPRCPALRKLTVHHAWGLDDFAVHSDSLLEIDLKHLYSYDDLGLGNFTIHSESLLQLSMRNLHGVGQLNVVAPTLQVLNVANCFAEGSTHYQPVANICAPQLTSLSWNDAYDPSTTLFGDLENLRWLGTCSFFVYGQDDNEHEFQNSYCLRLLQRFQHIPSLRFMLVYPPDITNQQYLMEDIARFLDTTRLTLDIMPNGHLFGASVFHVLRMCSGVRELQLTLRGARRPEAQTACPSGCVCDQPPNWKTEELRLNCLQEVAIRFLRGTEHEASLIKRLSNWARVLGKLTTSFHRSVTESKAKEFFQMLQSFLGPETIEIISNCLINLIQ